MQALAKLAKGLRVDAAILEVNPMQAEVVRLLFEVFRIKGSVRATCEHVNALGLRTQFGSPFSSTTTNRILRNPAYVGTIAYGKNFEIKGSRGRRHIRQDPSKWVVTENAHPAIVDRELFDEVQAMLDEHMAKHPKRAACERAHPWVGLIRCASCGKGVARHRMTHKGQLPYFYYLCITYLTSGRTSCTDYGRLNEKFLSKTVIPEVFKVIKESGLLDKQRAARAPKPKTKETSRADRIAKIEARREREKQLFREEYSTFAEMAKNIADLC